MRSLRDLGQEELQELLKYINELRKIGLNYSQIAKRALEEKGIKISRVTISRWCKGEHDPFNKIKFVNLEPSPSLAYIIGVYFGDASINIHGNYKYRVRLKVIDKEFAEAFARALKEIGANPRIYEESDGRRKRFVTEATSKGVYYLLNKPKEILFEIARTHPTEFLKGFFDSEGTFNFNSKQGYGYLSASNYDIEVLEFCRGLLKSLGIESRITLTKRKGTKVKLWGKEYEYSSDLYEIRVYRKENIFKFYQLIGFTISRKQQLLREYLGLP
ncbi:DNA endonuclease [Thermococcus sp. MV5]|uniref:LAGLIDADG family homing endonuclease n=1 Tax=Thermococcus sp. MV5 TaxID=1638272 RepID=UPI00143CBDD9|nr:LAGLIDADG family homing endonuclease [Thermococcus sp. MV5]NJE26330.1 DNA endonuclease [Thermococcus sp. MV5]